MNLEHEAVTLTRYLIKRTPSLQVIELYNAALKDLAIRITDKECIIWNYGLKNPWSLSLIDAGLASDYPHNNLRKRIWIMLAILETQVEYHSYFLPKKRPGWYFLVIAYLLLKAGCRKMAGKIFLWFNFRR